MTIATYKDIMKDFKFDFKIREFNPTLDVYKQKMVGDNPAESFLLRFGENSNADESHIIFNIDFILSLYKQPIELMSTKLNIILDSKIIDKEYVSKIAWSIPIIDEKSFTLLESAKLKKIRIKNVILFKPLFISEKPKIAGFDVIDLTKEEVKVDYVNII